MIAYYAQLIENHLEFLATHRGTVTTASGANLVTSTAPGFTCAILREGLPEGELNAIVRSFETVRLVPGGESNEPSLLSHGYTPAGAYVYMDLPADRAAPTERHANLRIELASDQARMADFTRVQAEGFVEDLEERRTWERILGDANLRNVGNTAQFFYIGYVDNEPAGVTLLVLTPGTAGIYAVATRPAFRRSGVSATLLWRAVEEARAQSVVVTLQVIEGSYAARFYEKLGFRRVFVSPIFTRGTK
jgi:GNAT superfamily N-acetyltransferase